jgi:hypothetical protein
MRSFIPRFSNLNGLRERLIYVTVSLCGLYDDLISILSFGTLITDVRAAALFEWFDDE